MSLEAAVTFKGSEAPTFGRLGLSPCARRPLQGRQMEGGLSSSSAYSSSSDTSSSYGYTSSASLVPVAVLVLRPRLFHEPQLLASLSSSTAFEAEILDHPERPQLGSLERCVGSATTGALLLLFVDVREWCFLGRANREAQRCLQAHLHLPS